MSETKPPLPAISDLDLAGITALVAELGLEKYRSAQILDAVWRSDATTWAGVTTLSRRAQETLAAVARFYSTETVEREARKVERLCGECRADEQLRAAATEGVKDAIARADCCCGICIEAIHNNRREESLHLSLKSLRSATDRANPRTLTRRAACQWFGNKATTVTAQQRAGAMEHQRPFARRAGLRCATISAEECRRKTAAIDNQQRLLTITPAQALQGGEECAADH